MSARKGNAAQLYPARTQPDGRVFYKTGHGDQDGWTDQLALAHPDYRADDAPAPIPPAPAPAETTAATTTQESTTMARKEAQGLDADFEPIAPVRVTEYMHYPLPPESPWAPSRFGQWGWYKLPHPETGRDLIAPRATTIAKIMEEQSGLTKWKIRERAMQVLQLSRMDPAAVIYTDPTGNTTAADALGALDDAMAGDNVGKIDGVLNMIDNVMGGAYARELGECAHEWIRALAQGLVLMRDVPEVVRPHVTHARRVIAHRGLVMVPEYCERTVLNRANDEPVAGKIDCIFQVVTTGELVLGDVKTSKSLEYSWLAFGVQIGGVYGGADLMLTADGKGWDAMPETNPDYAIVLHVPSNAPDMAAAITIGKEWGGEVMAESLWVKKRRKEAPKAAPSHAVPTPTKEAVRYAEARIKLSDITTPDDGQAVYETYQDVWDDALGEFGETIAGLL